MVGSALVRKAEALGGYEILTTTRAEVDLTDQTSVFNYLENNKPDIVIIAAAKVGGIHANSTYPADFIYDNLCIQNNVIHESYRTGVKKLLFLGSSCIYPKNAEQPIKEEYLLSGYLEPTNDAYAIAKIAGIKMCQSYHKQYECNFISAMPTNLYGPGDNYDLKNSHVLPALLRKFHEAKLNGEPTVTVWGTGKPRREFLHADDLADACLFLMDHYNSPEIINIGVGKDISIGEMAQMIKNITGYEGEIVFDSSMPDGTFRKLLDVSKLNGLGWEAKIGFEEGVEATYQERFGVEV